MQLRMKEGNRMSSKFPWMRVAKIAFPIVLLLFVFYQGKKELAGLSIKESIAAINQIPQGGFYLAVAVGLIAVSTMFFYDYILIRALKLKVSVWKIFRVSWIANSFNGVLGFRGLAGASLRAVLFREHTKDSPQLIRSIAWMAPSLMSGLSLLSLLVIVDVFPARSILHSEKWLWIPVVGVFAFLPAYILFSKFKGRETNSAKVTTMYTLVSFIEWFSAGITSYVIIHLTGIDVPFPAAIGTFVLAAVAGLISLVPGGLGSFDLVYIIGITSYGIDKGTVLSALLLYRLCYYLIPFGIGLIMAAFEMAGVVMKNIEENRVVRQTMEAGGVLWTFQRSILSKLGYWSLSVLIFFGGVLTILYMVMPIDEDLDLFIRSFSPGWFTVLSDAITLGCGIALILSARGIYRRTKRAYNMSIQALAGAAFFSVAASFTFNLAVVLVLIGIVLFLLRNKFNRQRSVMTIPSLIGYLLLLILLEYVYYNLAIIFTWLAEDPELESELTDVVFMPVQQINWMVAISALFVIVFFAFSLLLFERKQHGIPGEPSDDGKLEAFLEKHGGHVLSHLGYLGDKQFYFSKDGKTLLQFARVGKRLIVLGDPSGEPESFPGILEDFLEDADRLGYIVVFYQIENDYMYLYHDLGYRFFKLGEEAIIDLSSFTISGKKRAGLRALKNRFDREGYTFELVTPPFDDEWFRELKQVSDAFIGKRKEKGYSLGYFDRHYLEKAPIAILRDSAGKMMAFMSLMPVYREGYLSVDLMRYYPDSPSGIMDAMFIHLFEWAKEKGYRFFNMGMAPLSNVGQSQEAFFSERVAAAIFNNVNYTYSFSGLRRFKDKYSPKWEGKYLAYRKNRSLPGTMLLVTRLIGKRRKQS